MAESHASPTWLLMPRWFRRGLMIATLLTMCSCSASGQSLAWPACQSCPAEQTDQCDKHCVCECPPGWPVGPSDEYLCDGGDNASPVGATHDNQIVGLEQEDTVGIYRTDDGRTLVAPSTRTCIYAPRFAAVRHVVQPMGAQQRMFVDEVGDAFAAAESELRLLPGTGVLNTTLRQQRGERPPSLFRGRQQAGAAERLLAVAETRGLVGPYANLQIVHLGVMNGQENPIVMRHSLAAITWTGDQEVQVTISGQGASAVFAAKQPGLIYELGVPSSPRLRLVKLASENEAHPGDEVEFTLRFDNVGDAPIRDLVIVDNLTTRLEYVEDSAKASVDADFTTTRNEAGSLVLSWALKESLKPREGGVLTFRVRVR
ncbi:DUF11 domain-containing protein [Botrimarina hoheduenensis]|uniref:DUF11 domain-containing protein n=1 Tax=Botrimarina hoheduenensis TaxID=2528000 RepID=A0A5C5VTS9_9BACT|nr:DUF11 domain-containing protein [Botrimarina hoheduenensis]TWT41547.1 hypothetical protein Pla111_29240 [Botrimarina hoheduenensis]